MGYKLPDGRYVDDQGKTWKNYNDAAAAAKTRQLRAETELELLRQRQLHLHAKNKLEQGQLSKQYFGWVPGLGAAIDRGMQADARAKAEARDAAWALRGKLDIYEARMGEGPMPPTRDLSEGDQEPGGTEPPKLPPVLSDDADARASEARRMLQQATPYWDREENKAIRAAAEPGGGPRAGTAGYAQRADIQAWIEANKNAPKGADGKNIVDRFLEQQKQRGLLEAPVPTPQVDQLAASPDAQTTAERGYGEAGVDASALSGMKLENTRPTVDERFQNPAFGTEVLRGMPTTLATALTPDRDARQAIEADYSGGATPGAFVDTATLPNTAFVGNGMSAEPTLTPAREQDVPGITSPFVEPEEIRDLNLNGANALVRRHLNLIQGR